jgi:hypothetical protein
MKNLGWGGEREREREREERRKVLEINGDNIFFQCTSLKKLYIKI